MKEENQNGKERQMAEEQIDFRTLLFKYIIHWPWFVGAVLLCFVGIAKMESALSHRSSFATWHCV